MPMPISKCVCMSVCVCVYVCVWEHIRLYIYRICWFLHVYMSWKPPPPTLVSITCQTCMNFFVLALF